MAAAMQDVLARARPGDVLCSAFFGIPIQSYYARRLDLEHRGLELRGLPPDDSLAPLTGRRAWLVLDKTLPPPPAPLTTHVVERRDYVGLALCLAQF